ncbi:MAG: baseplate J/gp47 family protein [Terracidiphilus sp.]
MSTTPVCPCDAAGTQAITNLPGLAQIAFRAGDFNDFRRALLTPLTAAPGQPPLEQSLNAWQAGADSDPSVADLAVMMVEWWAYLADILTFYNERIANEDYLRTAALPETPAELIQLLGYWPRPAIGAAGTLAALVAPSVLPGQTVTLPRGLQFQSKPGPGGAPQTFELSAATAIGLPDQVNALPQPNLVANLGGSLLSILGGEEFELARGSAMKAYVKALASPQIVYHPPTVQQYGLLLSGSVTSVSNGTMLLLGARDDTAEPSLITLAAPPAVQTVAGGGKQTLLVFTTASAPGPMQAANARLLKANQSAPVWTVNSGFVDSNGNVHLAGVARQIQPNDWVVFTAPALPYAQLAQVTNVQDVFGDATSAGSPTSIPTSDAHPIPVLHTQLTLSGGLDQTLQNAGASAISMLYGWVEAGTLVDQPPQPWTGSAQLLAVEPAQFPSNGPTPILMQDSNGNGAAATGTGDGDGLSVSWPAATPIPLSPALQPPLGVFFNLLPVTCGKTVAGEILGSGDATQAGQSFMLSKSPVTYLAAGSGYASTVSIAVNGLPWTEVASFYGQPANAQVFVTRQDSSQNTWVDFGDGVNGARLTTGTNNVVASYRIGGGAASPPAGKLTVIAQSYPGLQSVVNPVAVTGGSDPDPAALLKQYAPRSVLTFGRAVSIFDYQALAAQAPGVSMATAVWSWDASNQRAGVIVYVAGEPNVASSVQTLLSAAGDPNRPVLALPATERPVTLTMAFIVAAGMDPTAITAAIQTALCDPVAGLFSPPQIGIGQQLFDSMIEAACLAVTGVVAIKSSQFAINGAIDAGPLHNPGEGAYFSLDPSGFFPSTEVAGND